MEKIFVLAAENILLRKRKNTNDDRETEKERVRVAATPTDHHTTDIAKHIQSYTYIQKCS